MRPDLPALQELIRSLREAADATERQRIDPLASSLMEIAASHLERMGREQWPEEPSEEMVEAGEGPLSQYERNPSTRYYAEAFDAVKAIYKAMRAAHLNAPPGRRGT